MSELASKHHWAGVGGRAVQEKQERQPRAGAHGAPGLATLFCLLLFLFKIPCNKTENEK